jgi:DNA-binding NarL/FixJ family response regulator
VISRATTQERTGVAHTRVLVVDDHKTFADLLALALSAEPDLECVGTANSAQQALGMAEALRPDLVIMDVQLGDGDGIATTAQLTQAYPGLRVLVLTAFVNAALMRRAADAGACALLPKDGALDAMLHAVHSAHRGGFLVHPALLKELVGNDAPSGWLPSLTQREQQVLQMLAAAIDTRRIARELGISVSTCRGYVKNVLAKLGAHTQLEAVVIATRHGMIDAPSQ